MTEIATELAEKPKRVERSYMAAEITRALTEVAACSGNTHMAARHLAEDGLPIDQKTLWEWSKRRHVEIYERIRVEQLPQITAQATEQHMALARQQMEASQVAASEIAARLPRMEDKDLVNAMGKFDIGSGIHTEKAQLLAGQPTARVATDLQGVLKDIRSMGIDPAVVIDAEVVGEEDVSEDESSGLYGQGNVAKSLDPLS